MAVISSEANIRNLPRLKEIARRLADPRGLSEAETSSLVEEGRTIVLVTCNIHATEIGASQMAMEWAHALAVAQDAETKRRLDEVVLLLVPSLNPDGQIMETEWYRKNLGTSVRRRPAALDLPPLRGARQQPRLVHGHAEGDARPHARGLPRVVPAGLAGRAPDGRDRPADLHAPLRGSGGPRHPSADLARGQPHRDHHGPAARAGGQERSHPQLSIRCVLAGGDAHHRLLEEHLGPPDRGRLGAAGHSGADRGRRVVRPGQGPGRIRRAGQLPQPLAGRMVAPARHHGLRADHLRRAAGDDRDPSPRFPARHVDPGPRGHRRRHAAGGLPHSRRPARPRRRPRPGRAHGPPRCGGEAGRQRRRVDPPRPALRTLRARDAHPAALPRGAGPARARHPAPLRRRRLVAAPDDGRDRRARHASRSSRRLRGPDRARLRSQRGRLRRDHAGRVPPSPR